MKNINGQVKHNKLIMYMKHTKNPLTKIRETHIIRILKTEADEKRNKERNRKIHKSNNGEQSTHK